MSEEKDFAEDHVKDVCAQDRDGERGKEEVDEKGVVAGENVDDEDEVMKEDETVVAVIVEEKEGEKHKTFEVVGEKAAEVIEWLDEEKKEEEDEERVYSSMVEEGWLMEDIPEVIEDETFRVGDLLSSSSLPSSAAAVGPAAAAASAGTSSLTSSNAGDTGGEMKST